MLDTIISHSPPFLVLSHPGHELRLFHWLETHRPIVFIMSDGSGGAATSRVAYSQAVLSAAGAQAGEVFGQTPDRSWYAALLAGNPTLFQHVVTTITMRARREQPTLIVSDAVDGHNPLHDICQAIGAAVAVRLASGGIATRHLVAPATATAIGLPGESLRLDEHAIARKQAAITSYTPLAEEARRILEAEPE